MSLILSSSSTIWALPSVGASVSGSWRFPMDKNNSGSFGDTGYATVDQVKDYVLDDTPWTKTTPDTLYTTSSVSIGVTSSATLPAYQKLLLPHSSSIVVEKSSSTNLINLLSVGPNTLPGITIDNALVIGEINGGEDALDSIYLAVGTGSYLQYVGFQSDDTLTSFGAIVKKLSFASQPQDGGVVFTLQDLYGFISGSKSSGTTESVDKILFGGDVAISGSTKHIGSVSQVPTTVVTGNIALGNEHSFVPVSASSPLTITTPTSPFDGQTLFIKDAVGNAATNNIIVSSSNANLIDGASTYTLSRAYESVKLMFINDLSSWSIQERINPATIGALPTFGNIVSIVTASYILTDDNHGDTLVVNTDTIGSDCTITVTDTLSEDFNCVLSLTGSAGDLLLSGSGTQELKYFGQNTITVSETVATLHVLSSTKTNVYVVEPV